jgi:hypothetical protein
MDAAVSTEPYVWVKTLGPGLVGLQHPKFGMCLWTIGKVRGHSKPCCVCGGTLAKGVPSYKPVTNGYNRMHRICPLCVKALSDR